MLMDVPGRRPGSASNLASLELLAYERIKESIITLELAPRSPIVEVQLAERLGISKTPLRAALLQLEREGLVDSVPYKGSRVAPITAQQIAQLYQLREAIEVYAVRSGLPSFTDADCDALEQILQRQEQAVSVQDYEAANVLDRQFHRYPVERLENPYFTEIFGNILDHRRRLRHVLARASVDPSVVIVSPNHWLRLAAFRARDVDAAERNIVEAIQHGRRTAAAAEKAGVFESSQLAGSR
jgi:GntR family transcriptional regulator, rspAB operon transcriptional repressor